MKEVLHNPAWKSYGRTVWTFITYLRLTKGLSFTAHGEAQTDEGIQEVTTQLEYIHRWTPIYKKSVLAKFYQLEDYFKEHPCNVTMITLTTYQDGKHSIEQKGEITTIPESFALLKEGWFKISKKLRKNHPRIEYAWIMEPHKTGYPHIHVAYFGKITKAEQKRLKENWQTWGIGSKEYGLDFNEKISDQSVKSIRNYLMKYMAKAFAPEENGFWTTAEIVFNALAWQNHWRLFGTTKKLTQVMKKHATEKTTTYNAVELIDQDGIRRTTWTRPGYQFLHEKADIDPDELPYKLRADIQNKTEESNTYAHFDHRNPVNGPPSCHDPTTL